MCDYIETERAGYSDREMVNAIEALLVYRARWNRSPLPHGPFMAIFYGNHIFGNDRRTFDRALNAASLRSMREHGVMLGALVVLENGPDKGLPPKPFFDLAVELGLRREDETDHALVSRLSREVYDAYSLKGDWVTFDNEDGGITTVDRK
jgi:hypothetical protein